jgi:GTPase
MNKIDALDDDERAERRAALEAVAGPVMLLSGVSREGLTEVLRALRAEIDADRLRHRGPARSSGPWRP